MAMPPTCIPTIYRRADHALSSDESRSTPHYFGDDASIMKSWILVKDVKLQFRWEAFNAFNHPTFGNPTGDYGNTVTWGNFGKIGTTGNIPPRVMQGALKLTF
jgi:hypothetical protein